MLCQELFETKDSVYHNSQDLAVAVYRNPSKVEISALLRRAQYHSLRGLLVDADSEVYLWDAGKATHFEICRHLGLALSATFGLEMQAGTLVYLINGMLHTGVDPQTVVERLKQLPTFRGIQISAREWRNR